MVTPKIETEPMMVEDKQLPLVDEVLEESVVDPLIAEPPVVESPVIEPVDPIVPPLPIAEGTLRQRNVELEQQVAQHQQIEQEAQARQMWQQQAAIAQEQARTQASQLVDQGFLSEDQGARYAQDLAAKGVELLQFKQQAAAYAQGENARMFAAIRVSDKYKVSAESLLAHNSEQDMEAFAKSRSEIQVLQDEIKALKQAQVPTQDFDNSLGSGSQLEGEALENAVGNGLPLTPDVQKRLIEYQNRQGFGG